MIDRQYKYLTSSTVVFYISYSLVYTEEGKNYRVGFSDVQIVVQPGSLAARMNQSWQKYFTDLGIFQILRPNLDDFSHFGPILVNFVLILANYIHFWTESFNTLAQDARKARIICRSGFFIQK